MSINTGNKTDWYGRTSGIKTGDDYVVADGPPLNATVLMDTYVFPTRTGQFFDYTFQWLIIAGNTWASIYNAGFVSQFDSGVQPGIIMSFTNGNNLPAGNHFYGGEFSLVNMADFDLSLY